MRLRTTTAAALAITALSAAGPVTASAGASTVKLARTSAGKILVTGSGFTLYSFSRDGRNRNRCIAIAGCASVWPALTVSGRPTAGAGVRSSLLGTIRLRSGKRQVTYAGHPLYRYIGDSSRGTTDYLHFSQFGGTWDGLSAAGGRVR
jgi:predicted lipoprotein with Yx(FWY)xxD motif